MQISGTTSEPGGRSGPEVLVHLDRDQPTPLYRQLADGLREAIRSGRLAPDTRMPSTRALAEDLGVSRRLVVEGYDQLIAEGFLVSRHGSGTVVARVDGARRAGPPPATEPERFDVDFLPGTPELSAAPSSAWIRALRQGLAATPAQDLGYVDPQGLPQTRRAVAAYLRRTRGVVADAEHVVICSGVTQAVALLARHLHDTDRVVAVENPGFWLHQRILRHQHVKPLPVPVDHQGLDVDALVATPASAVLCTPAHQSVLGAVLSPGRRTTLLRWARAGNLVIEDDYDAEYRFDRVPVGALQGLAPDHVVYTGSPSKTLAPGLRIGWLVVPDGLLRDVCRTKTLTDLGHSVMDQIALTQLLESGWYDRHLRLTRRRYRRRREALVRALATHLPDAEVLGAPAGVQLTVRLPDGVDAAEVVRRAATRRVRVEALAPCYVDPTEAPPGLILGYANVTETQMEDGVRVLAEAVRG
jgi:GntR family transcriptional regulator/MocR family aminotransferase